MSRKAGGEVATNVVAWQAAHGRKHLPWQQTRDPYRVWLSEIMLQQTQVVTVLGYYDRFLKRFPDVKALARAEQDEVMGLWSGLGYYSRARNLHQCAKVVTAQYGGKFPDTAQLLATLPGIGRSTAGAIAAFCFSERVAILDANVRRVLTRVLGFDADLAVARNEKLLWDRATELLPTGDLQTAMPRYTQGLMDLGATVCTPKAPRCTSCPLHSVCVAFSQGKQEQYPVRTRQLRRRAESWWLLVLMDPARRVWLHRRPAAGIWAGMHCVPVFSDQAQLMQVAADSEVGAARIQTWEVPPLMHALTHRDLHLHSLVVQGDLAPRPLPHGDWFGVDQWAGIGLPAPIRKLLDGAIQQPIV
jgi:A/G-specific adenine glycosylase